MERSAPKKKRSSLGSRLKRYFFLGTGLIVLGFGSLSILGKNGILDLLELQSLQRSLQNENLTLLQQQQELRAEAQRLNDPQYIEYLARERLGLMRPNEAFLILDSSAGNSPVDN